MTVNLPKATKTTRSSNNDQRVIYHVNEPQRRSVFDCSAPVPECKPEIRSARGPGGRPAPLLRSRTLPAIVTPGLSILQAQIEARYNGERVKPRSTHKHFPSTPSSRKLESLIRSTISKILWKHLEKVCTWLPAICSPLSSEEGTEVFYFLLFKICLERVKGATSCRHDSGLQTKG